MVNILCLIFLLFCALLYQDTLISAQSANCSEPVSSGPCRVPQKRYFYWDKIGRCKSFTYGGCKGNGNRFKTLEECDLACTRAPYCLKPFDAGTGSFQLLHRFYYDKAKDKCSSFTYNGYKGNENNFITKEKCEAVCKPGMKQS